MEPLEDGPPNNRRRRIGTCGCSREYYQPAVSSILFFLILYHACACNGFSSGSHYHRGGYANSELRRARIRRFTQEWSPGGTSSSTEEDSLFFAQDAANQVDTTQLVEDVFGATSHEDCEPFYAHSTAESNEATDESDFYQTQYSYPVMNSPTELDAQESSTESYAQNPNWDAPNGQATIDETKEVFSDSKTTPDSSPQPISSVDARVLESILQEGKLDLTTEEQVKKLLEGPRDIEDGPQSVDNESGEYSSKFVSVSMLACLC